MSQSHNHINNQPISQSRKQSANQPIRQSHNHIDRDLKSLSESKSRLKTAVKTKNKQLLIPYSSSEELSYKTEILISGLYV